ncbi:MAG TPA: hypothetical protein VKI44_43720 [Acetobacteraceae bacterium]|nr:hypothetical protein [Acetobacteraceae bacterium]
MKNFRSVVVLKRPPQELSAVMRDHLVEFAGSIADIQEIRQIERTTGGDGTVHIVNQWRVRQQIPTAIRSMLKIGELGWIDRNSWNDATGTCCWTIEPSFFGDYIACSGQTTFTEAMAGRGSRVTFAGELDLKPGLLGSLGSVEPLVSGFLETIVTTIIPRNLRAVVEAAAAFELPRVRG